MARFAGSRRRSSIRDGRVVARGRPPGRDRAFVICSAEDHELTLTVRPRRSSGLGAVIVSRSGEGAHTALRGVTVSGATPLGSLEQAQARLNERLASLRFASRRDVASGAAEVGERAALPLGLKAGCSRIDVVGGAPLGRFTASLWSPTDRRLGTAGGGETATLFFCGAAGKASLEVRAEDRAGPFAVSVAHEPRPAASLLAFPAAASMLLARLDAIVGPVDVAAAAGTEVVVAGEQRVTRNLEVKDCADVIAVSADGAGVTMRRRERDRVVASMRGELVVSDVVCSSGSLELWQERGSKVLLLVRERAE